MTVIIEELVVQTKLIDNSSNKTNDPVSEINLLKKDIFLLKEKLNELLLRNNTQNFER